jgi:polar amino acid transport system substrate-binding protein
MKKRFSIALAATAGVFAVATVPAEAGIKAPSFVSDNSLTVCTTANFPPITYKKQPTDEHPAGIDIDIIEKMASLWGAKVDYTVTEFAGLLPTLGSGRCSVIISGIYINDKRREVYDGAPYMKSAVAIMVNSASDITKPEDLADRLIALESGSYYREDIVTPLNKELTAAGKKEARTQDYPTQQAAAQQILIGRADATLTEEAEAAVRVGQSGGKLKIAYAYPSSMNFGIYIRRNPEDFAVVKDTLNTLAEQGFFKELAAKYNLDPALFDVDHAK